MTIPASTDTTAQPEAAAELDRLRAEFPTHLIGTETIPGRGVRYLARARQHDAHPHTVLTPDLHELRAVLPDPPWPAWLPPWTSPPPPA